MGAEADIIAYLTSRHLLSVADGAGREHIIAERIEQLPEKIVAAPQSTESVQHVPQLAARNSVRRDGFESPQLPGKSNQHDRR